MSEHEPMQYASGYSLDLYCDQPNTADGTGHSWFEVFSQTFIGETFAECAKEAKEAGWKIHRKTRTATCPLCVAKQKQR